MRLLRTLAFGLAPLVLAMALSVAITRLLNVTDEGTAFLIGMGCGMPAGPIGLALGFWAWDQ